MSTAAGFLPSLVLAASHESPSSPSSSSSSPPPSELEGVPFKPGNLYSGNANIFTVAESIQNLFLVTSFMREISDSAGADMAGVSTTSSASISANFCNLVSMACDLSFTTEFSEFKVCNFVADCDREFITVDLTNSSSPKSPFDINSSGVPSWSTSPLFMTTTQSAF